MKFYRLIIALVCLFFAFSSSPQQITTCKSPLMGWASWNSFHANITGTIIKEQADAMVFSGLSASGFTYINIDDGFFYGRYADGGLRTDSIKFPDGLKAIADYIHTKGLKAGMYSDAGLNTCGSKWDAQTGGIGAGMYHHDQQDVDLFFKTWGYDYLKVDFCGGLWLGLDEEIRYKEIKNAIDKIGRKDINYNVCRWQFPGTWVTNIANSWRISADIEPSWKVITGIIDKNTFLAPYISQGHYNDMDMLEVGNGMSKTEDKSHFSMWCILSSPLVLGNDLTKLSQQTKDILTNTEVIAVNQDTTGLQAHLVSDNGEGLQVWAKNLNGKQSKERAVVLLNRSSKATSMSIKWKDLNLDGIVKVRDIWSHTDFGNFDSIYTGTVPSHGVLMLKVIGNRTRLQDVFEAEYAWINNLSHIQFGQVKENQGVAITDLNCSGSAKASMLGNGKDNYIEFREIFAKSAGNYQLTISYLSGENRNALVSVNQKDTLLTNLNSGGWSTIATKTFSVKLIEGYNTIRFSNDTGWMPDLDKIQLDLNKTEMTLETSTNSDLFKIYPSQVTNLLNVSSANINSNVSIYNNLGQIVTKTIMKETIAKFDVSRYKCGLYFVSVDGGQALKFIKCLDKQY